MSKKQTAMDWLTKRLTRGHGVTVLQFFRATDCFHLPARIKELRARGYVIDSQFIKVGKKQVRRYFIAKDALEIYRAIARKPAPAARLAAQRGKS